MNEAGRRLFAGAGFAGDQDGGVVAGHLVAFLSTSCQRSESPTMRRWELASSSREKTERGPRGGGAGAGLGDLGGGVGECSWETARAMRSTIGGQSADRSSRRHVALERTHVEACCVPVCQAQCGAIASVAQTHAHIDAFSKRQRLGARSSKMSSWDAGVLKSEWRGSAGTSPVAAWQKHVPVFIDEILNHRFIAADLAGNLRHARKDGRMSRRLRSSATTQRNRRSPRVLSRGVGARASAGRVWNARWGNCSARWEPQ